MHQIMLFCPVAAPGLFFNVFDHFDQISFSSDDAGGTELFALSE